MLRSRPVQQQQDQPDKRKVRKGTPMKGWLSGGGTKDGGSSSGLGTRMRNALSAISSGSMNRKVRGTMTRQAMQS